MNPMVLRIFQTEVERQCKFALIAAQDLDRALHTLENDRIWYSVQSFLVAVGNVSKLLWPIKKEDKLKLRERGKELRTSLSVGNDSPLRPRTFRNYFEHFDEGLEDWATSSERHNFADSNVGPRPTTCMIAGLDPGDYLRNFDTENFAVTYRGDEYHLRPIVDAVHALWKKAVVEAQKAF